jgi:hypothetical protein
MRPIRVAEEEQKEARQRQQAQTVWETEEEAGKRRQHGTSEHEGPSGGVDSHKKKPG